MSLTKEITEKKVNFEFNKEFINVLSKKIKDNDTSFLREFDTRQQNKTY